MAKKKEHKIDKMVYAGRRRLNTNKIGHIFYEIEDGKIDTDKPLLFAGKMNLPPLGDVCLIPNTGDGWLFGNREYCEDQDYDDREELIKDWIASDNAITQQGKEAKLKTDAKHIENLTLKDIKKQMKYSNSAKSKALFRAAIFYLQ